MPKLMVYRIQDKEGRGPWKPGFSHNWVEDREDHNNLLPWNIEFNFNSCKLFSWEHFGCGCLTTEQLKRWFTKSEYQKLINFGYHAVEIDIDRFLASSEIQCVFARKHPLKSNVREFFLYGDAS